jgi:D-hexose-6-phosphate mutarotase
LKGAHYVDHVRGHTEAAEQAATLSFAGEFDRMYSSTATTLLSDPGLERTIRVDKQSSANTIVWNPWAEKAARLADLEGEQWRRMLCIESANAGNNAISLLPAAQHTLRTVIGVENTTEPESP